VSYRARPAREEDYPVLADFRWRLQTEDKPSDDATLTAFVAGYQAKDQARATPTSHWVVEDEKGPVGALSVLLVDRIPTPHPSAADRWGCLTNAYVAPAHRNHGAGAILLQAVKDWAAAQALELLIVWPSERSYSFYERAGFSSGRDPLVLPLNAGD
jgi:GNAT superfamily N-acetyltransferase